jgi:sec-independent protein translocase protein TatB
VFDISFSELMVIAFVALVVIGPEKLPKVARTAGAFFGRLQRFVTQVKDEVNREARFAELQTLQQEVQSSLHQGYTEIEKSILPSTPVTVDERVAELEPVTVKKARKPRQRKTGSTVEQVAGTESIPADQPIVQAGDLQAELFAAPLPEQKKTRRARTTVKKEDLAAPASEQKPLA